MRIKALDADCDRPANAEQGEQKRGGSTNVISCPSVSVAFSLHSFEPMREHVWW